ncbi:MAG: PDZ domain-containing protein [Planctomycetia bacterium]|nr:PDZ domain-containing protein [Planctomycetia bacterium]
MHKLIRVALFTIALSTAAGGFAQEREAKVRKDRKTVEEAGYWIYNDLPKALAQAKETGKPLLVALRCIPCEACAQLDAQIVDRDPVVNKLLDQFVCVRVVQTNGLDLSLFQYDYDQSFAAFFLNADGTIYGRYGTRSHETESERDVSVEGFARALEGALELHQQFPQVKQTLAAKRGPAPLYAVPEEFPFLKGRFTSKLDYQGNVVKSCIHCHQVGEAMKLAYREKGEAIPDTALYPYPLPNVLGLTLDPRERAKVTEVALGSSADQDGFREGDEITSLSGQPLLSIADVQWVLHRAGETGLLTAEIVREGKPLRLALTLSAGWRQKGNISWRAGSWDLRRMTTGGMRLDDLSAADRKAAGLADDVLALRARMVPDWAGKTGHGAAHGAGFKKGDILVELDGQSQRLTESQWLTRLVNSKKAGDRVKVALLRDGKRMILELPMQ